MYQSDSRSFEEKLKIGNDKEDLLVELLNLNGVPSKLNNEEDVKDIDIELVYDEMYVDSKYLESEFMWSMQHTGIEPENCLLINKSHVEAYAKKEANTGKKVWVAFLVDFKKFGIYEYRFFPNSYLIHKIQNSGPLKNNKLNVSRIEGKELKAFLDYVNLLRAVKGK
ncbi:MAG: hypothetical protein K0R18_441 [Bacillales bacterium]|nr:hypothetical protein [Bacillales bacterium]